MELHYVKKSKILESVVHGTAVVALCGERFVVVAPGSGGTGRSEICRHCIDIHSRLRSRESEPSIHG